MGFLDKFLRQLSGATPHSGKDAKLDEDLRKILKRLPYSTKRNLLEDLGKDGASARALSQTTPLPTRRASSPAATTIFENESMVSEEKKEMTAKEHAIALLTVDDWPELDQVKALHKALKKADEDWVAAFRESLGMDGIGKAMAELSKSREDYLDSEGDDDNDHEVPEEEVKLEEELVRCVMVVLNKPHGLLTLEASSNLLPILAGSAIDSSSNYVQCSLLKLLTIVAESGPGGFETVTNALDHVKMDRDEDLRFGMLVEAFGDADSSGVALVTDLIVFFNTILSSAFEFEERVMLRTEMISAGIIEAVQRIRDYYGMSKDVHSDDEEMTEDGWEGRRSNSFGSDSSLSTVMDAAVTSERNDLAAQLDLFDTVMNEDRKDAFATGLADEEDGEIGGGPPDHAAVISMRSVMGTLENEEMRGVVEVIAANMEKMVTAGCNEKALQHWKKIRDLTSSALKDTVHDVFMDSDDDDEDDNNNKGAPPPLPPRPNLPPPPFNGPVPPPPPLAAGSGLPAGSIPPPPPLPGGLVVGRGAPVPPPMPPPLPGLVGGVPPPMPPPMPPPLPVGVGRGVPMPPPLPMGGAGPPMPPPLPGMGGPPRPPPLPGLPLPPPLPLGGAGGLPRAPPPPVGLPGLMPRGPAPPAMPVRPKGPKRRPVHWDKIAPTKLEETVFNDIDPSSVDLPTALLAEAFAEKPKEKKTDAKGDAKGAGEAEAAAAAAAAAKKKKASEKVELLDGKTLRNNGIVFKRFRTKPEDVRDALVAMDLSKFDMDKLIALRGISPNMEDLAKLKEYHDDLSKLDEVSLFMVLTARIPRYQARLDCALFMSGFGNDATFLSEKLALVSEAVEEVVDSKRLKRLIEVVLAMGNYLNEGTRNGEAKAIKLASLLKLNTVKTMDRKKTLLHVLMSWAEETEPDMLLLDMDLVHSPEASQWSLTDLNQQVTQLSKGFTHMEAQLKLAKGGVTKLEGDKFAEVVEPFFNGAKDRMASLEADYERVAASYNAAAKRFGEDPTKVPSGDFFALVSNLLDMLAVAVRENELAAKADERRRKREAQEKKRRETKAKKELDSKASDPPMKRSGPSTRRGIGVDGRGSMRNARSARGGGISRDRDSKRIGSSRNGAVDINDLLKDRRKLIAVGPEESESDTDSDWDDEEGAFTEEYERVKTRRVNEAVMLRKISKLTDPSKREIARGQLPYQKSVMGRQPSMTRQKSSASPAMMRQVSAVRQASNLRAMSAIRQASIVQRGGVNRNPSTLRPSNAGGGMGRMGGLSTSGLDGRSQRQASGIDRSGRSTRGEAGRSMRGEADPRKQFKTLKSTAFLA